MLKEYYILLIATIILEQIYNELIFEILVKGIKLLG